MSVTEFHSENRTAVRVVSRLGGFVLLCYGVVYGWLAIQPEPVYPASSIVNHRVTGEIGQIHSTACNLFYEHGCRYYVRFGTVAPTKMLDFEIESAH